MTLVLGGTGKTGRRVAEGLKSRGLPVRIGSRSGEPRFDWEDEGTWKPALRGVGSVYVWFNQNFDEGFFVDQILRGEVALPVGNVGEPFLDVEDIADVAVAVPLVGDVADEQGAVALVDCARPLHGAVATAVAVLVLLRNARPAPEQA